MKTLVDSSHKSLKHLRDQIVDNDEIIYIVVGIKVLFKEDRYNNDSIKDIKKKHSDKIKE